jgi:hypothetical protein
MAEKGVGVSEVCKKEVENAISIYKDPENNGLIDQYMNEYYNIVESKNAYPNNIHITESTYFVNKYGKEIYNELLAERDKFLKPSNRATDEYNEEDYSKALENIHVLNQVQTIDKPILGVIDKYIPEYDSNTIYREIEYRNKEYERLYKINYYLNILYYCGFVLLIIILITSGNLFIRERFVVYIFLGILPFLYPWVFRLVRKLYNYFNPPSQYSGPKNAFIDTNISQTAMFSNNVSNSYKNKVDTTTVN